MSLVGAAEWPSRASHLWKHPSCSGPHLLPAAPAEDFPGETFRVLKEKEEKQFGEYRTRRLVLAAWARQQE